jgi:hypothetical protein
MSANEIPAELHPPEWRAADWEAALLISGSLPDITVKLNDGDTWDHMHAALRESDLRREYWYEQVQKDDMASADGLFQSASEGSKLLKVWVGSLQFNSHYFASTELDFDVEVAALGSRSGYECLVAFMDLLATVTGNRAIMVHEGSEAIVRSSEPIRNLQLAREAVQLADLRNTPFVEYRDVVVPGTLFSQSNVDSWLERHPDPIQVSNTISHVHMYDMMESVDTDDAVEILAEQIAVRWRETLSTQFPNRHFEVGVSNELDDDGPTLWVRRASPAS